jgi:hypothetical protein
MFRSTPWSGSSAARLIQRKAVAIVLIAALTTLPGRTVSVVAAEEYEDSAVEPNDVELRLNVERDEPACTVAPLTLQSVLNSEYTISDPDDGDISFRLSQGRVNLPDGKGMVRVVSSQVAFGDLDGDGCDDAVAALEYDPGRRGPFVYVVPMVAREGSPRQAGREFLGERASVEIVGIAKGVGTVVYLTHGPTDAPCCPTRHATKTIRLMGARIPP